MLPRLVHVRKKHASNNILWQKVFLSHISKNERQIYRDHNFNQTFYYNLTGLYVILLCAKWRNFGGWLCSLREFLEVIEKTTSGLGCWSLVLQGNACQLLGQRINRRLQKFKHVFFLQFSQIKYTKVVYTVWLIMKLA